MTTQPLPFSELLGIELRSVGPERVEAELTVREDLCTRPAVLHGGALMAFADSLGGICAYLNLPDGAGTATISSNTAFMRAVRDGEVTGVARPLHAGRSVIVVQTDLTDDGGRRVAQVTQAQAVLNAG